MSHISAGRFFTTEPPGKPMNGIAAAAAKSLSHVRLCVTPWTAAHQAPPSMGFSRQEHWSGGAIAFSELNARTPKSQTRKKSPVQILYPAKHPSDMKERFKTLSDK